MFRRYGKTAIAVLTALMLLLPINSITAFALSSEEEEAVKRTQINLENTKVFEGYSVTVLDKTTPAVSVRGRTNDRNVMCFVSAADKEVGVISHSDYNAIIQKNRRVVNLPGGGSYGVPPVDGKSWEDWFADEFNKYRALGSGSREEAVATNNAETIEKYRQEVIQLVNAEREKAGLPAFESHEAIMDFAQVRAEELIDNYSHTRPDGSGAGTENAARGQMTPAEVVTDWMNSARHKANILKPANDPQNGIVSFTHIGVGCYRPSSSSGGYYWVLTFGYGPDSYSSGY